MSAAAKVVTQQADDPFRAGNRLEASPQLNIYAPSGVDWQIYLRWREGFEQALDPLRYTIAYVDHMVWTGGYALDVTENSAVLTEALVWPTGAWELRFKWLTGDANEALSEMLEMIEERAWKAGAIGANVESREGWYRLMKPLGYELYKTEIRKLFPPLPAGIS